MMYRHSMKIIMLLLTAVFLAACQPTPSEELVKNRLDGALEAAIRAEAVDPYRYEAPERWAEMLEIRGRTVRIDAEIVVADAERFPVLTIMKDSFDAQRCIDILTAVYGEATGLRENEYSYEEVMIDLQNAQRGHYYEVDDERGWGPYEGQEEDIARLQQILAALGPEDTYIPLNVGNLGFPAIERVVRLANEDSVYLRSSTGYFSVRKHRDILVQPENWVLGGDATPGEAKHALENINILEQDAKALGNAVIAALARPDFQLAKTERARAIEDHSYDVHGEGYLLTYVSCPEGAFPVDYQYNFGTQELPFTLLPEGYVAAWRQERISLFVTESGVLYFAWGEPKIVVNTANVNTVLLPFGEIRKSIRDLLSMGLLVDEYNMDDDALISRIVLGTAIQQIPNQGDEAFLVPAWVISYNTVRRQRLLMEDEVFMLNALDGLSISAWVDWGD